MKVSVRTAVLISLVAGLAACHPAPPPPAPAPPPVMHGAHCGRGTHWVPAHWYHHHRVRGHCAPNHHR